MANRGDEAVHKIAKRARDDEETAQQGPGPAQPPRDSQRGRRSQINLAVLDQNQAARCLASHPVQGQERRGLVGLGRAKSKIPLRVTRRDELYGALAERAGPVEEHGGAMINAAARGRVSRGRGIKSFYGLTFTVIIMQVLGIVLCKSSPSCRASLCLPGVN